MTREQKYPDTSTFHFFNANPFKRLTGDCTYRAISTATGIPYNTVVMEIAQLHCETGYCAIDLIDKYLKSKGWVKNKQPKRKNGKRFTGVAFCRQIQKYLGRDYPEGSMDDYGIEVSRRIVANIGANHIVAIIDGKVFDTWDSSDRCIGNYWTTEPERK